MRLDADRLVAAVATGIGLSFDPSAAAEWQASHGGGGHRRAPMDSATLGAVLRQFPGAIRVN